MSEDAAHEIKNYYNYFTEVEDHFRIVRGTGLWRMSTLDWALVESWKDAGVPLEAVLRGITAAFEKWRSRKHRTQMVNCVAYCAQAIAHEAQIMAGTVRDSGASHANDAPPFTLDEVRSYLGKNAVKLRKTGFDEIASKLDALAANIETEYADLESLEQTLTALEDKLIATQRARLTEDELIAARRELDLQLRPYRTKMTADQLAMLEKQYLDRRLLERADIPRLSLFYLH
jgi:hypothetical protein